VAQQSKLGLGGHSYIEQLGNDPQASFAEQCALVATCLDNGIKLLDTTYYQERVALGKVLRQLGRRDEAQVMAWNFFKQPGQENDLVPWTPYEPQHIDIMLSELQTDRIDVLVIHAEDDVEKLRRGMELARQWRGEGKALQVGLGMAQPAHMGALPPDHPFSYVLAPYNAFNQAAAETFARARAMELGVIAMSPFIRGWKLDEIGGDKAEVASLLLRWVASQDLVDRVIVSMRKKEWVAANLKALERGPLTDEEQARLQTWIETGRDHAQGARGAH
jgi:aryl-alcohol dehydrogenase-like predicted oxidoreductase